MIFTKDINKTRIQCKECKRFFKDNPYDIDANWEILNDKEHNPDQLCFKCLDRKMTGVDRTYLKRWNDCERTIRERMEKC